MRNIKYIVLHCTATPQTTPIESIQQYWRTLGWRNPGYHFMIKPSGEVINLLPIEKPSNGVAGYNSTSIHISYIGGIDANRKALDNRTEAQKEAMIQLIRKYSRQFPGAKVLGHRDFPKVAKDCPSFSVSDWLKTIAL